MDEPNAIQDYRFIEREVLVQLRRNLRCANADDPMAAYRIATAKDLAEIAAICRGQIRQWEADQASKSRMPPQPGQAQPGIFMWVEKVPAC